MAPRLVRVTLTILTSVLVGLLPRPAHSQERARIRYGVTASVAHLPVLVAKEAGLFQKYGFDVEVIHIRGGALITMTIMSGSVQFSGAGAESVVAARIEGGDVVLLACPVDQDAVYLVARPEIKSAADLKGKTTAVTRLGSTTHFYLRSALGQLGIDEREVTILQLGAGGEIAAAMMSGRVIAAALTFHNAFPFMQMGWPVLVDLSKAKSDFVYPSSCVASSRAFIKNNSALVERFLKAYLEALRIIKRDSAATERIFKKWQRETDALVAKKTIEVYAPLFKSTPYVPDKGLEIVLRELARRRAVPKEFLNPDQYRDHAPLEKIVRAGWIDQLYK